MPPFRTPGHQLAVVTRRPHNRLPQLAPEKSTCAPFAVQATITDVPDAEAPMHIEDHICFWSGEDDNRRAVRPQQPFVHAYVHFEGSTLPRDYGIATLPFVALDCTMTSGDGIDRELGLVFEIAQDLRAALGDGKPANLQAANEACDWLRNRRLVDVETGDAGRAIVIALAPTLIERPQLALFPAFFVTAAQRGSGKTTVLNRVSTALTGSMAPAASWSFDITGPLRPWPIAGGWPHPALRGIATQARVSRLARCGQSGQPGSLPSLGRRDIWNKNGHCAAMERTGTAGSPGCALPIKTRHRWFPSVGLFAASLVIRQSGQTIFQVHSNRLADALERRQLDGHLHD